MKIGEFANKHEVTIDTVRHYISEGLLTPLRENTQYNFSEIDDSVMDSILLLKNMNFKLNEMKAYLLFQTTYTGSAFSYLGNFKNKFEKKLEENTAEIERLKNMNQLIERQLANNKTPGFTRGVSLKMLEDLVCAECGEMLELSAVEILHNEIMEGTLVCPKCNKTYYIRYGIVADRPIDDINEEDVAELMEQYLKTNDKEYIQKTRELFQKMAEIAGKNSQDVKRVLIDGESCEFLDSCLLREMPKDARLFVHVGENIGIKFFMEDLFPKEALIYYGDVHNMPLHVDMDYVFLQDYDIETYHGREYNHYPRISKGAKVDCFKALLYGRRNYFPDESKFLEDMNHKGFVPHGVYRTGRIFKSKESIDLSMIANDTDLELEYGIFTFVKQ